jgi:hypothetical protein
LFEPLVLLNPALVERVKSIKRSVLRQDRRHGAIDTRSASGGDPGPDRSTSGLEPR